MSQTKPIVSSYNEWDPLEEVIVGTMEGASVPPWHVTLKATMPENHWDFYKKNGGKLFPAEQIKAAQLELDNLAHILEQEGVIVRRPDPVDFNRPYSTPDWKSEGGLYSAMPRDVLLVIGENIIEAPMPWRSRHHEVNSFRPLIKEYFNKGAKWSAAPKPQLLDELYDYNYQEGSGNDPINYVINDFEPVFDAADFTKCGKDIFVLKSHVTNDAGIKWLQQHIGDEYIIHKIDCNDRHPMHIDTTFVPLAPGKLLIHPDRMNKIPEMFKSWDIMKAPAPVMPDSQVLYMSSKWLTMNTFMIDSERILVEKNEKPTIEALKKFGMKPIPCSFYNFNTFGGGFHCATLDIRRTGELKSYF